MTQKFDLSGSLGESLKKRRLELELSLSQIERRTGISKKYLKRLEKGDYQFLPHNIYSLGYAKRYGLELGFDQKIVTKKYLLERGPLPSAKQNLQKQQPKSPIVTTKVLLTLGIALCGLLILGYLILQLLVLTGKPRLTIIAPESNQVVHGNSVEVRGRTAPGGKITIDGAEVLVSDDGSFAATIRLREGLNTIEIKAHNSLGRSTVVTRSLLVPDPDGEAPGN